jgi:hypothetical protein
MRSGSDRRPPGLGRLSAHGPEYDVSDRLSFVCSRTTRSASNVLFPTWQRKRNATVARGHAVEGTLITSRAGSLCVSVLNAATATSFGGDMMSDRV